MFLVYNSRELILEGYSNASFQSDDDDAESQSGFVFKLNGRVVAWKSSKKDTTTYSTTEVEYIVTSIIYPIGRMYINQTRENIHESLNGGIFHQLAKCLGSYLNQRWQRWNAKVFTISLIGHSFVHPEGCEWVVPCDVANLCVVLASSFELFMSSILIPSLRSSVYFNA
ncbi:UNVERIFIED_CONTAM: Secreted RxLR effector protein [Sesamum radiatum]|uniref:Secreted RxLR effector protein n=1 Tax=Sesamum radiatum TaxID=300843 RepID=A0AAW2S5J2_SESRA